MTRIHPTAVVDPKAHIDPTAEIGAYCVVGPGVVIGPGTALHNHVTVMGPTRIGRDNLIYPYAVLGAEPQDLKYRGTDTTLLIGDRNRIREQVTIHRGTEMGGGKTTIGSDCMLMVGVHVAHDCTIDNEVVIANGTMLGGHCHVELGAVIAGGAGIHHFTTVGTMSFVGGMARIVKDVPPYLVVEGAPAEPRKVNTTALVRRHWPAEDIERLRQAYRLIFRTPEIPALVAIESLRHQPDQIPAIHRLCDFLERAQLGVHGRQKEAARSPSERGVATQDEIR
ncbi:MAG: acyl-ACP--UDP-N-acetylglucosamine O-acyltransferase [Planctomycetota bacterium]|nr:acyl-ACP--UDP-N-acetylglucosamine O-acyltransferase [Planctomycetota bacterium]